MTITLDLPPHVERGLQTKAAARGLGLDAFAQDILAREAAGPAAEADAPGPRTGQSLIDACAKLRGLLTDEEVDALFARSPSSSRSVEFE